jgi:DNA-binding transcriptional ArsR family regulator/uncharacterized protein YndB with AHSA1/START domain
VDEVFKALADPTRRRLLDELFREDGQTLHQLEAGIDMTRFGVMKHLKVLEEAGLVVTRRQGREKLHHLNPVPIRLVHDRWVSKYAEPWAAGLSGLKDELERTMEPENMEPENMEPENMEPENMEKVFEVYIKTTPERLWDAITDPATRAKYNFGAGAHAEWQAGSRVELRAGDLLLGEGEILEADPPRRLVHTQLSHFGPEAEAEGYSRVTWEIEPVGDSCRVTVVHDQMRDGACEQLYGGWPMILSGLKTWLETGELLTTPGSLMYT